MTPEHKLPTSGFTLIEVMVLLPVFFMEGLSGAFFRPLAQAYIVATLVSPFIALTVTPALVLILLNNAPIRERISPIIPPLHRSYVAVLSRSLMRPIFAYSTTVVLLVLDVNEGAVLDSDVRLGADSNLICPDTVDVTFGGSVDPATLTPANFTVRYSANPTFFDGDDHRLAALGLDAGLERVLQQVGQDAPDCSRIGQRQHSFPRPIHFEFDTLPLRDRPPRLRAGGIGGRPGGRQVRHGGHLCGPL